MNRLLVGTVTTVAVAIAMPLAFQLLLADEPAAMVAENAQDNDAESLDVRYARAYLELAKTELQNALAVNRKVRDAVPDSVISPLRQVVAIAEAQLEYALHEDSHGLHAIHLRQAEMEVEDAERDLQKISELNERADGLVSSNELQQARLRAKVAKLGLQKAQKVNVDDPQEHLQWQLEELQKELLQLRSEVARLSL